MKAKSPSPKKLEETGVFSFLKLFFQEIELWVSSLKTKKEVSQLNKLLPHLFRRWYYTAFSLPKEQLTPYAAISQLKDRLPTYQKRELFVLPFVAQFSPKEKQISQLSFMVKPLKAETLPPWLDFYYQEKGGQKPIYEDKAYHELVSLTKKYFSQNKKKAAPKLSLEEGKRLTPLLLEAGLISWWSKNLFLSKSFSLEELKSLFFEFLKEAKRGYVEVDLIFEILRRRLSKNFPLFKLVDVTEDPKISKEKIKKDEETKMAYFAYWNLGKEFDQFFLTPATTFLWILEPWWQERKGFYEDLSLSFSSILRKQSFGQTLWLLFAPCASFQLNALGRQLL